MSTTPTSGLKLSGMTTITISTRLHLLAILIFWFSSCSWIATAHFFPNISSIPPGFLPNATSNPWEAFHKFSGCRSGEKSDGLAKLKQYFRHFGYIPGSSNFTDDFDDQLQSALKTYQKNFNLNVTGELDDQTLQYIVRPRCGNADIVNGSTSMNSGKSPHNTSGHFHSVAHYTFFPGSPRWPSGRTDLTYGFLPENQLTDAVKALFTSAFARWEAVIPLTFTQTDNYYTADIRIAFYVGDHGDGEPFDGVLGTLAHAFSPPSGRFHLDGDENWVVSGDVSSSSLTSAVDLESVAVHEIGHLLGLGHSSVENAIMYPSITSRTRKVDLASDDIEGIQSLYGSNPSYNGSTTTTSQERDVNNGTHSLYSSMSMWALGLLVAVGYIFLLF